ncbi:hypothetical protein Tco_1244199 [Tanacetum coccineum]
MSVANLSSADLVYDEASPSYDSYILSENKVVNASLTAELATYKEQVELKLKKELHSVKLQLTSTINHNKSMVEEVTSLKKDFKQKENKYLEEFLDMKALKEKKNVAIGYKNPLYLTRTNQVQPALYNGHEIIKTNHVPAIMHNSKDTLEIAEITRKKINDKMKDPECVKKKVKIAPYNYSKKNYLATFTPQKQLTPEQIFWYKDIIKMKTEALKEQTTTSRPIKALTMYPPNTPATLALTKEIKEMKEIFKELEAEVDQNVVNRKHDEIERNNLLIANDNLIADCLSKEVFYIATNSELTVSSFAEMHDAHTVVQARYLELEAELSKLCDKVQKDDHTELVKCFSNLEELLEYVIGTCLKDFNQRDKKHAATTLTKKKQVTFEDQCETLNNNTHKHVVKLNIQKTNVTVFPSTGVNSCTDASGSQPRSNTKKNRISLAKSVNKKKVEAHLRTNKSNLKTNNRIDSSISSKRTKATGKVLTSVGYQWRPTGRILTLGEQCPLPRLTKPKVMPAKQIENVSTSKFVITPKLSHTSQKPLTRYQRRNQQYQAVPVCLPTSSAIAYVIQIILWYLDSGYSKHMMGNRSRLKNFMKKFIGTVQFENDHFGAIMGYGDYMICDSVISRVYYVEGLGHNLSYGVHWLINTAAIATSGLLTKPKFEADGKLKSVPLLVVYYASTIVTARVLILLTAVLQVHGKEDVNRYNWQLVDPWCCGMDTRKYTLKEVVSFREMITFNLGEVWLYDEVLLLKLDWAKNKKTKSSLKKTVAFAAEGNSNFDTDKIMARMDAMTMKMDAQYKDFQSHSKQTNLDGDDIPMSREEEAKFMQTFRRTCFYNDYRDRDSNRDNWRSGERNDYNRDNYQSHSDDKPDL